MNGSTKFWWEGPRRSLILLISGSQRIVHPLHRTTSLRPQLAATMACFGKSEYWNERYSFKNERYEWFQSYDGFRHLLTPAMLSPADGVNTYKSRRTIEVRDRDGNIVPRSVVCLEERPPLAPTSFPPREHCRVLMLGCGNSCVAEAMLRDGWTGGIVNVDFSHVVIQQMKVRYDKTFYEELNKSYKNVMGQVAFQLEPMEFVCADVTRELPFADASFDLIICKGTLDAILSSAGSVADVKRMMHECCRLLRDPHGALVVVTHSSPDNRLVFFENRGDEWWAGINVHTVPLENRNAEREHYVYTCRKRIGGGMATRPFRCVTVPDAVKDTNSLIRSSSDEENDATIAKMAHTSKDENLKISKVESRPTALTQMQVSVLNH